MSFGFSSASKRLPTSARLSCQALASSVAHKLPIAYFEVGTPISSPLSACQFLMTMMVIPWDRRSIGMLLRICGLRCAHEANK